MSSTWVDGAAGSPVRHRQPAVRRLRRAADDAPARRACGSATRCSTWRRSRRPTSSTLAPRPRGALAQRADGAGPRGRGPPSARWVTGLLDRRGRSASSSSRTWCRSADVDPAPAVRGRRLRRLLRLRAPRLQRRQDLPPRPEPLLPNWRHLPVGYHGRSGTVVGVRHRRSCARAGSARRPPTDAPTFGPSRRASTSRPSSASWSAPPSALGEPGRRRRLRRPRLRRRRPQRLVGARHPGLGVRPARPVPRQVVRDLDLATGSPRWRHSTRRGSTCPARTRSRSTTCASTEPARPRHRRRGGASTATSCRRPPYASMYWSPAQMLAHLTVNGASLRTGDLFASGTVSRPRARPARLVPGAELGRQASRSPSATASGPFLEDGDEVVLRYTAPGANGGRIALGEVRGTHRPGPLGSSRRWRRSTRSSSTCHDRGMASPDLARFDDWLAWLAERVAADPDARCAWIGGSAATGGWDEWSDLDVVVLSTPGTSVAAYGRLLAGIRERFVPDHVWELPTRPGRTGGSASSTRSRAPAGSTSPPGSWTSQCSTSPTRAGRSTYAGTGRRWCCTTPTVTSSSGTTTRPCSRPAPAEAVDQVRQRFATAEWLVNRAVARGQLPEAVALYLRFGLMPAGPAAPGRALPLAARLRPALPAHRPASGGRRPRHRAAARRQNGSPTCPPSASPGRPTCSTAAEPERTDDRHQLGAEPDLPPPAGVHRPSSVPELQSLVAASSRLKALGTRHCFNDIADTDGDQVDARGCPRSSRSTAPGPPHGQGAASRYGDARRRPGRRRLGGAQPRVPAAHLGRRRRRDGHARLGRPARQPVDVRRGRWSW